MIKTAILHCIIDIGINAFFDNVQQNFTIYKPDIYLPDNLISGCRCDVCIIDTDACNLPIGTKLTGSWYSLIFNGIDKLSGTFYFITMKGEWIDINLDNIAAIVVTNDDGESVMYNNMYTPDADYDDYDD